MKFLSTHWQEAANLKNEYGRLCVRVVTLNGNAQAHLKTITKFGFTITGMAASEWGNSIERMPIF